MSILEQNSVVNENVGLSSSQVDERIKQNLTNKIFTKTTKTYAQIFFGNIFTWFNFICFLVAGVLIAIGSFENVFFIVVFIANLCIGLIQEIRAKKKVDSITVLNTSKVTVLRDGEERQVEIFEVVKDDIIFLKNGDQICADCYLLDGDMETNESLLTGESKPIKKKKGDLLLGGSFIVSGAGKAIASKVGMETYSSKLIRKAREFKDNQSDILKTLNFIIKIIGIIIIPLGTLTFLDLYYGQHGLPFAIERASGSIIGMMPVGMFLLTSVSLVVGVFNLAKQRTLVQDIYSIEMLARASVLCLDKTGTLTDGTMTVKSVLPINSTNKKIFEIMKNFVHSFKTINSTSIALSKYFTVSKKADNVNALIEFSSEKKFSAVEFEKLGTFILGAPEFVTNKLEKDIAQTIKNITQDGYRVVLLCESKDKIIKGKISKNNEPIAIITIQDNIRPDAKKTIDWFNKNDVKVKIISGDNVDTVSNISKKVGVLNYDMCISLENLSDDEVSKVATKYTVFGRVTPEQKYLIIHALKLSGERVAMTGDGVNDILALKESDCSIAMASGSEATRSASNLIMLEDNFSAMPTIVTEGRRVINNISKASSLFLTKTFFTIFLTIFVLFSKNYNYPLQPNQILLWETFFVGFPAFFLALQPNNERIKGSFLANLSSKTLPGAIVLFLGTLACYIYSNITNSPQLIPTLISYTVTFGAFFILFNLCFPFDRFRFILVSSSLAICLMFFLIIPISFFGYHPLSNYNLIFLIITIFGINFSYFFLRKLFEKIFSFTKKKAES
ncbi:MAG: HAD family hydrolase [Clostridia bacterium]|nr:HAD family hydrolase [Clostridia bacterium]